ncbi:hypothetical protein ACFWVB_20225 [Streptomyces microflavus]|uniref:hypothetical protein n=1 Tax=Streptomyces microflavus TaxID=1919 RepID=UPI00365C3333
MTDILVHRGALREADGFPVLEKVRWAAVPAGHADAVKLPDVLGLAPNSWWQFGSGSDVLSELPIVPQVIDSFGNVIEWGGLAPGPVDVYNLPLLPGFVLVAEQAWRDGYEEYRLAVDPIGMPPLPVGGQPVLYLPPA